MTREEKLDNGEKCEIGIMREIKPEDQEKIIELVKELLKGVNNELHINN